MPSLSSHTLPAPPNILFICTDQLAHDAMSCADNGDLHTPHLDKLAAESVRFTNAYCTFPLCTPSRMSLLTGRMPAELGISSLRGEIPERYRHEEIGNWFSRAGYHCAYGGKWHAGGGLDYPEGSDHGFEKICTINDLELPESCASFLQQKHDKPFLLVASFDDPHNICEHRKNQVLPWGEIEDVPVDEYPNLPANFSRAPQEPQSIRQFRSVPSASLLAAQMAEEFDAERWRQHRHFYFRIVERVDALIGQVLESLEKSGHADDTVLVFSSDHGEMNGSHEISGKFVLYEESVKVPFFVRLPGQERGGETDLTLVSLGLDLLPTLCGFASIDPPEGLHGRNLRPFVEGTPAEAEPRDYLVAEAAFDNTPSRMVRSERYKYVLHQWGSYREQLFDLQNDPGERINLAIEKRFADLLHRHRNYLADWCKQTGDSVNADYSHPGSASIPGLRYFAVDSD